MSRSINSDKRTAAQLPRLLTGTAGCDCDQPTGPRMPVATHNCCNSSTGTRRLGVSCQMNGS